MIRNALCIAISSKVCVRFRIPCCCGSCIAQFTENSFMPNSCVIGFVLPFTVNSSITN